MATIRIVPSSYQLSNTSYLTISNANNMYTNVDSTTMATINHTRSATTAYYIYLRGFNFSQIPSNAIINSAIVKVKAYVKSAGSATPGLYNNTTSLSKSFNGTIGTTATTRTVDITSNFETYKGYGNNFGIRLQLNRSNKNTASSLYIYGAEITVDYTEVPTEQMMIKQNGAWKNVTNVYKKNNGNWVEQTDLKNVFDINTSYINANISEVGRNLLLGTRYFSGDRWNNLGYWEADESSVPGFTVYKHDFAWFGIYQEIDVIEGEEYTFSFFAKGDSNTDVNIYTVPNLADEILDPYYVEIGTITNEFVRYSYTFRATSSGTVNLRVENANENSILEIYALKLEKGNVATDWSPAPEDN